MFQKIITIILTTSILFSCQQESDKSVEQASAKVEVTTILETSIMPKKTAPAQVTIKQLSFTATVKYMNVEGGFFGLITKEGKHWLPMNLK